MFPQPDKARVVKSSTKTQIKFEFWSAKWTLSGWADQWMSLKFPFPIELRWQWRRPFIIIKFSALPYSVRIAGHNKRRVAQDTNILIRFIQSSNINRKFHSLLVHQSSMNRKTHQSYNQSVGDWSVGEEKLITNATTEKRQFWSLSIPYGITRISYKLYTPLFVPTPTTCCAVLVFVFPLINFKFSDYI